MGSCEGERAPVYQQHQYKYTILSSRYTDTSLPPTHQYTPFNSGNIGIVSRMVSPMAAAACCRGTSSSTERETRSSGRGLANREPSRAYQWDFCGSNYVCASNSALSQLKQLHTAYMLLFPPPPSPVLLLVVQFAGPTEHTPPAAGQL